LNLKGEQEDIQMFLKETGLDGLKKDLNSLDLVLDELGFHRAWDYKTAHYDFKYDDPTSNQVYYLRVPATTVQGVLESPFAVLELNTPYIGRHLFPHGLDRESEVPSHILEAVKNKLSIAKNKLSN
jgi:hypothetical protein